MLLKKFYLKETKKSFFNNLVVVGMKVQRIMLEYMFYSKDDWGALSSNK